MKTRLFLIVFFCFVALTTIYGQKDPALKELNKELKALSSLCKNEKTTARLDQYLLNNPNLSQNPKQYLYFLSAKIDALAHIYKNDIKKLPKEERLENVHMKEIISLWDEAYPLCKECQLPLLYHKYDFYRSNKIEDKFKADELEIIKQSEYRPERKGSGLGLRYMYTPYGSWVGGDFSFFQMYQKSFRFITTNPDNKKKERRHTKSGASASALTFGYARNLENKRNEFVLNILSLYRPFTIKPFQFGRQWEDGGEGIGFYRPELGYGWGPLYVSAGYNLFFKKAARDDGNHLVLTAGYTYPIFKNK